MSTALPSQNVSHLADADMQAVPAALARAALRARELAARTGTPLVVTRDGQLIEAHVQADSHAPKAGQSPDH
jgi:hypothetical protein